MTVYGGTRGAVRWGALSLALWGMLGAAQAAAVLDGRTLTFSQNAQTLAALRFPESAGDLSGPVTQGEVTWLGVGPALYGFTPGGTASLRLDFSDVISSLDASGGVLRVTAGPSGEQDTYTVSGEQIQERVVFVPDTQVTGWLKRVASQVPEGEVAQAAAQDPTNPFLALRLAALARQRGDRFTALSQTQRAASLPLPFPALLQLAAQMEALNSPSAANLLLSRAGRDYAARGYDPALPISRAALKAYGDPLGELEQLLGENKLERADVWIRYLRQTSPRFEGSLALYARYAELLDAQGRSGEAEEWRAFARTLTEGTLYNLGADALLTLRDAARLSTLALLISLLAAYLTLAARAWRVQGQDTAALGGRWGSWLRHPLSRLRRSVVAYSGLGEKLVLLSLLSAVLLTLSAWTWAARTETRLQAPALNIGTYGGAWFYGGLDELELSTTRETALLRGLSAQLDGDDAAARSSYEQGGAALPCVQNNLGVLAQNREDSAQGRELWRASLSAAPDLLAPAYNLGLQPSAPEAAFQREYRGAPRLCYPDQRALVRALGGSLAGQLRALVLNPWSALLATPTGLAAPLQALWVTLLLLGYALCVVWLLTPTPTGNGALDARHCSAAGPAAAGQRPARRRVGRGAAARLGGGAVRLLVGRGWCRCLTCRGRSVASGCRSFLVAVYALNTVGLSLQELGWLSRPAGQHRRRRRARLAEAPGQLTRSGSACLPILPECLFACLTLFFVMLLGRLQGRASAAPRPSFRPATDQTAALLSGQPAQLRNPPRLVQGRTLLPLLEVAALLGQPVGQQGTLLRLGRLLLDVLTQSAAAGRRAAARRERQLIGGALYVNARLLADGLSANLSFSDDGRSLILTALPLGGNPLAPQARFSTDKASYAPGEQVIYTDYPFDPDGADIVSRKWSQQARRVFQPGSYTVTLQVTNARGQVSAPYSRTLTVAGPGMDTPLSYALKYADPGESFPDALRQHLSAGG